MYALRELCACISLNRHPPAHPVRDALSASAGEAKYTEPIPEKADEKELDLVQVLYIPP